MFEDPHVCIERALFLYLMTFSVPSFVSKPMQFRCSCVWFLSCVTGIIRIASSFDLSYAYRMQSLVCLDCISNRLNLYYAVSFTLLLIYEIPYGQV